MIPSFLVPRRHWIEPRRVFVAMPFEPPEHHAIYERAILPAIRDAGLKGGIVQAARDQGDIFDRILIELQEAEVLIADTTGAKGNVLYEVGLFQSLGKHVLFITQDQRIPFDVAQRFC